MILKKIGCFLLVCLVLAGCSTPRKSQNIAINTSVLTSLKLDELEKKLKDKETFLLVVTQTQCTDCDLMKRTILPFVRNHGDIIVHEVILDEQGDMREDTAKAYQRLSKLLPHFTGSVPSYLYVKEGKVEKVKQGVLSEIEWQNFMIACELIDGKVLEEEKTSYSLTSGKNVRMTSLHDVAEKLRKEENFYLYYASKDRYNEAFSKKLNAYANDNGVKIALFNMDELVQPSSEKEQTLMNRDIEVLNKTLTTGMTPCVYYIVDGKVKAEVKDNVKEKDLKEWFKKYTLKN